MEQHTVEVTFDGERITSVTDESGTFTLYRTPEDTHFVHMDTRHVDEETARVVGRDAVLEEGCFPRGLPEDCVRRWFPQLFSNQSAE